MSAHNPDEPPPDDTVFGAPDHLLSLLEVTVKFFQQASPQVRAELALFPAAHSGWSSRSGLQAYLDSLAFIALGLRDRPTGTQS